MSQESRDFLCLECNHLLDELIENRCPECGRPFNLHDLRTVNKSGRVIGKWVRWWLRAPPWPAVLVALAVMLGVLWPYRSPTRAMVALAYLDFCGFGLLLLPAGRVIQLLVRTICEKYFGLPLGLFRSRRRFWPWVVLILGTGAVLARTHLVMLAGFHVSWPALDRIADAALADPAKADSLAGQWAGVYHINGVEVIGETVVIYLGTPGGSYGFARAPGAKSDRIFSGPLSERRDPHYFRDFPATGMGPGGFSRDPWGERISGDWFVMYSMYWSQKIGWS